MSKMKDPMSRRVWNEKAETAPREEMERIRFEKLKSSYGKAVFLWIAMVWDRFINSRPIPKAHAPHAG
jgi:hypothetical protein